MRSKDYQEWLIEKLKDKDEALAYLNAALEESSNGDSESIQIFLIALRNVAEAQGGMTKIAKKANVGRESLYKSLSPSGNITWRTLLALMSALGLQLQVS